LNNGHPKIFVWSISRRALKTIISKKFNR